MPGYHIRDIPKGKIGDFSKVNEEFIEFVDAIEQKCTIMAIIELADMVGAIRYFYEKYDTLKNFNSIVNKLNSYNITYPVSATDLIDSFAVFSHSTNEELKTSLEPFMMEVSYFIKNYNLSMADLISMADITKRAFLSGQRK